MKEYERPVATVNDELAEGVYMASGDTAGDTNSGDSSSTGGGDGITVKKGNVSDYGKDNCHVSFTVSLPSAVSGNKKIIITCNQKAVNAWGGGFNVSCSGETVTVKAWGGVPASFDMTIVGNTGLDVTGISIKDA